MSKKKNKNKWLWVILSVMIVMIIGGGLAAQQMYYYMVCNLVSKDGQEHSYHIYPGTTLDEVLEMIEQDYKVLSPLSLKLHIRYQKMEAPKEGFYTIGKSIDDRHLLNRLRLGLQTPVRLTFNTYVRTREQLAGKIAHQMMLDSTELVNRLNSDSHMAKYGLSKETALTLFLPNTYEVYWTLTEDQLLDKMYEEYQKFWNEKRLNEAKALGLTPTEVCVLASIAASETNKDFEYPIIAGLYLNRIRIGMPMQACPTVIYAGGDFSVKRVTRALTSIESPYNTYINKGLPPGPIRVTRAEVIDSTLHATKSDYLYMCANPDFSMTHVFSSTYAQHSAVAKQYQRELNKRKIH